MNDFENEIKDNLDFKDVKSKRPSKYAGLDSEGISLGLAESDFEMPREVKETIIDAVNNGRYHYEFEGVPEFLEAAKEKLHRFNHIDVEEKEILPIAGGMNGIWLTYRVLLKPGDRVLVVTPNYPPIIEHPKEVSQAETIEVKTKNDFHLDIESIEKAISDKVRMISICNPNNPSGAVYTKEELEQLADIAQKHNLLVFSDELYENLTYDERTHVSIASLEGMQNRTITVFAFTKTYGMSGLRIGYLVANKEIVEKMKIENSRVLIHPGTIEQLAAATALKKCNYYVEALKSHLERVRNHFINELNQISGVKAILPEGTFFAFPDLSFFFTDDRKAAEYLEKEAKVRVHSGSGFGKGGEGHVRMNFCTTMRVIDEAVRRIHRTLTLIEPRRLG
ncbi:MAG: pyridoxal phosphate-dependent aminotransferase [Thermoproteota archaeon]|jgi:aspartate aminotransferase